MPINISKLLLCLYPRVWRLRYEEEFLAMLESCPLSISDALDMLRGAIDAHMHPYLGTSGMPLQEKLRHLSHSLRASLILGFCAYITFVLAGCGFEKLSEDYTFMAAANTSLRVGTSFHLVVIGGVVSLLAVIAAGLPIILVVVKCALVHKRRDLLALLAVPFFSLTLFIGTFMLVKDSIISSLPWMVGGIIFFGGIVLVAAISTIAVCAAVMRSAISSNLLCFAVLPSCIATVAMIVVLVATLFWGVSLQSEMPHLLAGNGGIMRSSTMDTLIRIIGIMVLAIALAASTLWRAVSVRSHLRRLTA